MSKKDKPKLGRSFDSIIDDDNDTSHKKIFQKFVASDTPGNKTASNPQKPSTGKSKKPVTQRTTERRTCNSFIWYRSEEDNACSGLGRACEVWDEGIIIETARIFPLNSLIHLETTPQLNIRSQKGTIVNCTQKGESAYLVELKYNF